MSAVLPELSIAISQKRRAGVFDPTLAFSPFGIPLVKRLGEVMELWVAREHWHILDNTDYYLPWQKELKLADDSRAVPSLWPDSQALCDWERMRAETDPATLKLFWIGDGPGESMLPPELDASLVRRFEALASSLDRRLKSREALMSSFRDAVALSVTLPSAIILTQMSIPADSQPGMRPGPSSGDGQGNCHADTKPLICRTMIEDLEFDCKVVEDDEWQRLERDMLRQQLVAAGLAKFRWLGLRLAVVHVFAPSEAALKDEPEFAPELYENESILLDEVGYTLSDADYWHGAKAFWYPL